MRRGTGRRPGYLPLAEEEYHQRLADDRVPTWPIAAFSSMFASVREGRFELVSADIPRLTGEPQQSYAEFMRSTILQAA